MLLNAVLHTFLSPIIYYCLLTYYYYPRRQQTQRLGELLEALTSSSCSNKKEALGGNNPQNSSNITTCSQFDKVKQESSVDSPSSPYNTGRTGIHIPGTDFSNKIRTIHSAVTNDAAETQTQTQNRAQNKRTHEEMQNKDLTESSSFEGTPELVTSTIDDSDYSIAGTGIGTNDSSNSSVSSSKRTKVDVNEVNDADARSDEQFGQEAEVTIAQGGNDHSSVHARNTFEDYLAELISFSPLTSTTPISTSNEEKRTHEEVQNENSGVVEPFSVAVSPEFDSNTIHNTQQAAAGIVTNDCASRKINNKELYDDAKSDGHCRTLDEVIAQEKEDEHDHSSSHDHGSLETLNTFEKRFKELTSFKAQHGHCHPPESSSSDNGNNSLGMWCVNMRRSYKKIQEKKKPCLHLSLSEIDKLETLGFVWDIERAFEDKFAELSAFKAMHGHCNPPRNPSTAYFSLGQWFFDVRKAYEQIQKGKAPQWPLSQDQIRRLENLGFKWKLSKRNAFEERFVELTLFMAKYGHCSPPQTSATPFYSLAIWCNDKRRAYKQIQEGKPPRHSNLTQEQIVRLEKMGFEWTRSGSATQIFEDDYCRHKQRSFVNNCKSSKQSFEERIADLIMFKDKHGHFYPPETSSNKYCSLARWCNQKRRAYSQMQQGKTPQSPISQDQIRMLESLDFTWDSSARANIVRKLPVTPDQFLQKAMAVIDHRFVSIVPSTAVSDGRNTDKFDEKDEAPFEVILPPISPDSMKNKRENFRWCPVCYVWNRSCCKSRWEQEESIDKQIRSR